MTQTGTVMEVHTESGNIYYLKFVAMDYDGRPLWTWTVKEPRSMDRDGAGQGVVIYGPEVGMSLTLAWVAPDGRLKFRFSSRILEVLDTQ